MELREKGKHEVTTSRTLHMLIHGQVYHGVGLKEGRRIFITKMWDLRHRQQYLDWSPYDGSWQTLPRELWIQQWVCLRLRWYLKYLQTLRFLNRVPQCEAVPKQLCDIVGRDLAQEWSWRACAHPTSSRSRRSSTQRWNNHYYGWLRRQVL